MSTYLMRLATRGRPIGGVDALQPFVRSRSPIAERDQRIGVAGIEPPGANTRPPPDEARIGPLPPNARMPDALSPVGISADRGGAGVTVRRKPDSTISMAPGLSTPTTTAPRRSGEAHHCTLAEPQPGISAQKYAGIHADIASSPQTSAASRSPLSAPQHEQAASIEPRPTVSGDFHSHALSSPADGAEPSPLTVRRRSVRDIPQWDSTPRIEPSSPLFPDTLEAPVTETGIARGDGDPRVVIERGNVDVVQPPVATETRSAIRSGPLTAASVSVIGPLGGHLASRMAFGLRYR